ncbi:hypothetical protein D0Y60_01745 [Shinella sp. WSJ-2]|nr:hypothetical protein D0Y60_01745 [Shinella sp. WSJ-2]
MGQQFFGSAEKISIAGGCVCPAAEKEHAPILSRPIVQEFMRYVLRKYSAWLIGIVGSGDDSARSEDNVPAETYFIVFLILDMAYRGWNRWLNITAKQALCCVADQVVSRVSCVSECYVIEMHFL